MASRIHLSVLIAAAIVLPVAGVMAQSGTAKTWHNADGSAAEAATAAPSRTGSTQPATAGQRDRAPKRVAQVSMGKGSLPNAHGQLWREYDISPYTLKVASTARPEQTLVDWILRETGYEAWHGEPIAILNANRRSLVVYHTPQIQQAVADVVDRFVANDADAGDFRLGVATLGDSNWRSRVQQTLQSVQVQTPGVQAWLLEREAAVALVADLRRRTDYREHSSPQQLVDNGQSTVVSTTQSQYYVRDIRLTGNAWPGYQSETAVVDEGFSLEFTPLLSVKRDSIDAIIKVEIDKIEKMVPVMLDVPTAVEPRQRAKIEIPQLAHFQFHERFRWTPDKVLLVCMGMVPLPVNEKSKTLVPGLPIPIGRGDNRGDLLVMIEARAPGSDQATPPPGLATRPETTYSDRR